MLFFLFFALINTHTEFSGLLRSPWGDTCVRNGKGSATCIPERYLVQIAKTSIFMMNFGSKLPISNYFLQTSAKSTDISGASTNGVPCIENFGPKTHISGWRIPLPPTCYVSHPGLELRLWIIYPLQPFFLTVLPVQTVDNIILWMCKYQTSYRGSHYTVLRCLSYMVELLGP